MMFDRLLGFIDNHNFMKSSLKDPHSDVRLATAVLLFNVVPADYQNLPQEGSALMSELAELLEIGPRRCRKLVARAAAARNCEPSIFACANLLRRKTSPEFRQRIQQSIEAIALSDGFFHPHEHDLALRAARLLQSTPLRLAA
jgi:uncharacterized tellurite resistance protein B-like protein